MVPKLSILFDLAEAGVGESAASVGGVPRVWVGRPKCKAPAGFPSVAEPVRLTGSVWLK